MDLYVIDFDDTLFRSPYPPPGHEGPWWEDVRSLMPPHVPRVPGQEFWLQPTLEYLWRLDRQRQPQFFAVVTGRRRTEGMQARISELLRQSQIPVDALFLQGIRYPTGVSNTAEWKAFTLRNLIAMEPTRIIVLDDRPENLAAMDRVGREAGIPLYSVLSRPAS